MAKVRYVQGSKSAYLGLSERSPTALYYCTDTKELFKGDDLYTDGIRFVNNYAMLPQFIMAAEGVLYICRDTGCGYVLSDTLDEWIPVIHGVDNETITMTDEGLLTVKEIPIDSVAGLTERLEEISNITIDGVETINFAGVEMTETDGCFSIDKDIALDALGINLPQSEDGEVVVIASETKVTEAVAEMSEELKAYIDEQLRQMENDHLDGGVIE